jgi:hypothetical protein
MIRQMNVAWMSAIVMAGMVFAQGQIAPGKEDDGDDSGAPTVVAQDWSVAVQGWKPVAANEHPRLIFRKDDVPTLRKRAQTPAGTAIIERAKKLLESPLTTWHAAGHAFLYQVTGDQAWADKAKEAAEQTLARRPNPDGRYTWPAQGQLRAGPCLSALRGDAGVDANRIEELLGKVVNNARRESAAGYGSRGHSYEGHHCGRLSSHTGLVPFIQAYRVAMGRDLVPNSSNAQWLLAKWVYGFVDHPPSTGSAGLYMYNSRGMYAQEFGRGGGSSGGDFSQGCGICPKEHVPAVLSLYNHIIEPGEKTYGSVTGSSTGWTSRS